MKVKLFQVDVPESSDLLSWDRPITESPDIEEKLKQSPHYDELRNPISSIDGEPTGVIPTGRQIYQSLEKKFGSDREASLHLNSLGIPGLRFFDDNSRGKQSGTENFVIWDEDNVTIEAVNDELRQAELFAQGIDPTSPDAPSIVTEADVNNFLDNGTTGNPAIDAAVRRATHEQFARGFETYLMEGKAPSVELRNAFRSFARWLTQIYQAVRGKLNVNLDDEMRQVFARLLATDEQIAAAEARARIEPMFTDAAMAGLSDKEFADYEKRQAKVEDKQTETLRDKLISQLTRQTKARWKEEKQDIIDEVTPDLLNERVYRARNGIERRVNKIRSLNRKRNGW